jgi:hypothetical protein
MTMLRRNSTRRDHVPGVPGRVLRADGGGAGTGGIGLGHTRDCRRNGPGPAAGHAEFATPLRRSPGGAAPGQGPAGDRVGNRSLSTRKARPAGIRPDCRLHTPSPPGTTEVADAPQRAGTPQRGVLRQAGAACEFRHIDLQHRQPDRPAWFAILHRGQIEWAFSENRQPPSGRRASQASRYRRVARPPCDPRFERLDRHIIRGATGKGAVGGE